LLKVTPSLDQVKAVALLGESMPLALQVKFSVKFDITKAGPLIIGVASWNNLK
jgi:hypothetical protein